MCDPFFAREVVGDKYRYCFARSNRSSGFFSLHVICDEVKSSQAVHVSMRSSPLLLATAAPMRILQLMIELLLATSLCFVQGGSLELALLLD